MHADCGAPSQPWQHAIMNLPATAIDFLDAFRGAFSRTPWGQQPLPLIHCYAFSKPLTEGSEEGARLAHSFADFGRPDFHALHFRCTSPVQRLQVLRSCDVLELHASVLTVDNMAGVRARVEAALGGSLDSAPDIHTVRDVAPNKRMLCISFRLPSSIAFAADGSQQASGGDASAPAENGQVQHSETRPSKRQKATGV